MQRLTSEEKGKRVLASIGAQEDRPKNRQLVSEEGLVSNQAEGQVAEGFCLEARKMGKLRSKGKGKRPLESVDAQGDRPNKKQLVLQEGLVSNQAEGQVAEGFCLEALKVLARKMGKLRSKGKGKRPLESVDAQGDRPNKKQLVLQEGLVRVIVEAVKVECLQEIHLLLEPRIQRIVSKEVERALMKQGLANHNGRISPKQIKGSGGRVLQLHFRSGLSLPLFTGRQVVGKNGAAIPVVLRDANTGQVVSLGSESVKLDVVVLEGDFIKGDDDDDGNWTQEEFESYVVKERDGKGPLLTGDLQVSLKQGVGILGKLAFTDNSSWVRSKKFRLGLKIASGYCEDFCIQGAKTEAFSVKDHRGELYKKHYPPMLNDDVWRLEKIRKDGEFHKRLCNAGVVTVEDFLGDLAKDSQKLRNILGSSMTDKAWDALVEHARTCVQKVYVYYANDTRNEGVVFNRMHKLIGLFAGGQYYSADSLPEFQKVDVNICVKNAYKNWKDVIEVDHKFLLSLKRYGGLGAPQAEAPMDSGDFNSDCQFPLPSSSVTDPSKQHSMESSRRVGERNGSMTSTYPMRLPNMDPNSLIKFDNTSNEGQNQFITPSHPAMLLKGYDMLAYGPPELFTTSFPGGTSKIPFDMDAHFLPKENICVTSCAMLEGKDVPPLHSTFDFSGCGRVSINVTEGGTTSNPSSGNVPVQCPSQLSTSVFEYVGPSNRVTEDSFPRGNMCIRSKEMPENMESSLGDFDLDVQGKGTINVTEDGSSSLLRNENAWSLGQSQLPTSDFQAVGNPAVGTSTFTYGEFDSIPDNVFYMGGCQFLGNEDMQNSLNFDTGFLDLTSLIANNSGSPCSLNCTTVTEPNNSLNNNHTRLSGKAVVGWLKLKASLRWGFFIRKRAAERRAQLVELKSCQEMGTTC